MLDLTMWLSRLATLETGEALLEVFIAVVVVVGFFNLLRYTITNAILRADRLREKAEREREEALRAAGSGPALPPRT